MLFTAIDFKTNAKQSVYYANRLLKVQREFPELIYVVADSKSRTSEVDQLGGMKDKEILVGVQDSKSGKKYLMTAEFSQDNLRTFVNDYLNDKVESYIKSEPVPTPEKAGEVKTIVAKTFESMVQKNDKQDVLIMMYAPWCGT